MRKSDFALISALYDSKRGGLYSDVYFPIIKYTIVSLFYNKEGQQYYTQDNVKEFIVQNFGIEIPSLVIKKSIAAVSQKSADLDLELYENGSEFRILKAWDFSVNEDIDAKARYFNTHIDNLENEYRQYVESEGIYSDKTFLNFISDNTDDILGYFENESIDKIDSEYAIMAYFLKHLQKAKPELFKIANELFWGSVIAGFLKREKVPLLSGCGNSIEYFLDTPIVMGLLRLSTTENEQYSKDVLDIIIASGGLPKIHPITMEEVISIISSVENADHPIPNTPIEAAWYRDGLSKSKLARRRLGAIKELENMGIIHFPTLSQQNIANAKNDYTNKSDVRNLTQTRGGISSDRGLFRDIHDIFMDDYIEDRRRTKGNEDCCFFVTTNTELIRFCKERKADSRMRTIGASKIILELWMHNTKQSGLESNALTEMIARCMDMNNRDVRNKLGVVSKHYNSAKCEDFDPELFQEIVKCLYKRDKDVIEAIDSMKDEGDLDVDTKMRCIIEKAHASIQLNSERNSDIQYQIEQLRNKLSVTEKEKDEAIEIGRSESVKKQNILDELNESKSTVQKQSDILICYKEKDTFIESRDKLRKELNEMEVEKANYIEKNDHYLIYLCLEVCLILVFVIAIVCTVYQVAVGEKFYIPAVIAVASMIVKFLTALTRKSLLIIERKGAHDEMKMKVEKIWLSQHPEYEIKRSEYERILKAISELEDKITNLGNS